MTQIQEAMGRHREQIILVIDEIHLVCQLREQSAISEHLKTLLDPSQHEGFPYVIGITTEEEYYRDIYLNNEAFARRFKRIVIENTNQEETLGILRTALAQKAPDILVEPATIQYLYEQVSKSFPNAAAPASFLKILFQCVERVSGLQKFPLEKEIEELCNQIQSAQAASTLGHGETLLPYERQNIGNNPANLRKILQDKQTKLENQKAQIQNLLSRRKQLERVKQMTYSSALKVTQFFKGTFSSQNEIDAKRFLLISHLLGPSLERHLKQQSQFLGFQVEIDRQLIDSVIQEEKDHQGKAKQIAARGLRDMLTRQIPPPSDRKDDH